MDQLAPGEPREFGGGRYVVRRRLGAGNFATVYLADDERLAVSVAVKLLSDRWSWEPEVRGRFVQEARLLRSLNDSHVVQIRDIAETADGRPYLVMDYATEGTLEQRMVELSQRKIRPHVEDLRQIARALAAALGVLHERRIAHRDIKPSNLLITRSGSQAPADAAASASAGALLRPGERLMLGDLGLAKDLRFDSGVTVGVGTAGYMAPEQTLAGAKIDTRTDVYAATALLAQLASGESPDPMRRVSSGELASGRPLGEEIPAELRTVLLRGLDTDPDLRPQTIEAWLTDVERALDDVPTDSDLVGGSDSPSTQRRWLGIAVVGLVCCLGLAFWLFSRSNSQSSGPSRTTTTTSPASDFTVSLSGPIELTRGVQAIWTVDAPNAVDGIWTLDGPVQPIPPDWSPGNYFQGTWNLAGTFTLTLTATDKTGRSAADSITFTVT